MEIKKKKIKSIEDIKRKTFAFGDIASTSSHLIPKKILLDNKLVSKNDYTEVFLGTHDAVAISVQNGVAEAGGLSEPIFNMLIENGIIQESKINLIQYSNFYPQYPWVYIDDLDKDLKKKISSIFLNIKDKKILSKYKADGFSAVKDADYDIIRGLSKKLELYEYEK